MSTFAWIDHSEKQRRQILEAIDLFREKDTRDELGISIVRDAFADLMFPGTGSLQTRARYFFFVPWMYRRFEEKGVPSVGLNRSARDFEIKLIDTLAESSDSRGTIGIVARGGLQRVPSSIYWNGLKILGICRLEGSQADYHRQFERLALGRKNALKNDDGEMVGGKAAVWAQMPAAPSGFPAGASLALTAAESAYLHERIIAHDPASLFAYLVQRPHDPFDAGFVWDHSITNSVPKHLQRQLQHARNFSEIMFGAPIIYNLNLADMAPVRDDVRERCLDELGRWRELVDGRRDAYRAWDRTDFWNLLRESQVVPSSPTQWFVDAWVDLVLGADLQVFSTNRQARDLVVARERNIKGPLARCDNARAREVWRGESGLARIDYRWANASEILRDIFVGMGALDA